MRGVCVEYKVECKLRGKVMTDGFLKGKLVGFVKVCLMSGIDVMLKPVFTSLIFKTETCLLPNLVLSIFIQILDYYYLFIHLFIYLFIIKGED